LRNSAIDESLLMPEKTTKIVLEQRLIRFSVNVIQIAEKLPLTRTGNRLADQIIRSGTSSALNYGEAQSAESRRDFVHKLGIVLKELRETQIALKIILQSNLVPGTPELQIIIRECDELLAIFYRSVQTAKTAKSENMER
jgi:four helix bundle protein